MGSPNDRVLTRRAVLVGAVLGVPLLALHGCTPAWRVVRRSPQNRLAGNRHFALAQIDVGASAVEVRSRDSDALAAALRARLEAGGRWHAWREEFDVFSLDEAPQSAFELRMGVTILRLGRRTGEASMRLTVVEPSASSGEDGAIVDQVDMVSEIDPRIYTPGAFLTWVPRAWLMRTLGNSLADTTLRYLGLRTSERPRRRG